MRPHELRRLSKPHELNLTKKDSVYRCEIFYHSCGLFLFTNLSALTQQKGFFMQRITKSRSPPPFLNLRRIIKT